MSNQTNEIVEAKLTSTKGFAWRNVGIIISTLALIIFMGAFGFGYFQLSRINLMLAKNMTDLQSQMGSTQQQMTSLQQSVNDLQQLAQKAQDLTNQQAQMIADWQATQKGNLSKWYVAEAQYLVKLANDQLLFTQNSAMALTLLQRAQQVLDNLHDTNLMAIHKSLATDIANLQAQPQQDISQLYVTLSALDQQLDQLPIPTNPLQPNQVAVPTNTKNMSWWQAGMQHSWDALQKIVIVKYNGSNALPLLMPEEKTFLYQNLHAQMQSAMWAALHHYPDIYQQSISRLHEWVQQYFVQDSPMTKNILERLSELQKINVQPSSVNLSVTLQQLDIYLTQTTSG